ncbi:MAG TPA: hypothetical protein VML75_06585 [Kofleriaceae bacterium]|nr:hypothetical protein [Kofleriaceae bacterium]
MIRLSLAALASAVLLGGCSIEHKSGQFACTTEADCSAGRTCTGGFCVAVESDIDANNPADADPADPDGSMNADASTDCPPTCTSCVTTTCVINCGTANACPDAVVCPAGWSCKVECEGLGACAMAVDCSQATNCLIECTNTDTCQGPISCGPGRCRVECGGDNSCAAGIACQDSCQCDTFCDGLGACATAPTCPPPGQCTSGINCISGPGPCFTC